MIIYNVRGLNEYNKRRNVFYYLHKNVYEVVFIQESHSSKEQEQRWSMEWGNKIWFSHGETNARGVCILFSKKLQFTVHNVIRDKNSCYLILYITISQTKVLLVNVYAPNRDVPEFFKEL